MRHAITLGLAAAALALGTPAVAQTAPAESFTPEQQANMDRAGLIFSLFANAIRRDEIPGEEKNGLIACLYSNTLEKLSEATGKVLAENPDIDASNVANVYAVAAIICGAREPGPAATDAAPASAQ